MNALKYGQGCVDMLLFLVLFTSIKWIEDDFDIYAGI